MDVLDGLDHQCYFQSLDWNVPPRQFLRDHIVSRCRVDGLGGIVIHQIVNRDGIPCGRLIVGSLYIDKIFSPVGVFDKLLITRRRNHNLKLIRHWPCNSLPSLRIPFQFFCCNFPEDIITRNHIFRAQCLPMVITILHIVVQANLLQVLTVAESTVLNHDFHVAV